MFGMYTPLVFAVIILYLGILCYYLQKYEIDENSKLFKYRPNKNNILIKLKLFKYDWRFNYFLLIPYLISWLVFIITLILYMLYWIGVKCLIDLFLMYWFHRALVILILLMEIYIATLQTIINFYNEKAYSLTKEEKKLLKQIMRSKRENKDKQKK